MTLPLVESNFIFEIYRRSAEGVKLEDEYKYKLPLSSGQTDICDDFFVSFEPRESCVKFECNSFYNIHLTLKWLIHQVMAKTMVTLSNREYYFGKRFIPRISYIIASTKYGDQVIDIEPYFLLATREFGFTLDFRFSANEIGKHTIHEKILSLSLSSDGQKNKNFYSDKHQHVSNFIHLKVPTLFPIQYTTGIVEISGSLKELPYVMLKEKQYVFANERTANNQFSGLSQHQPFQLVQKEPLYVFIFQKSRINISRELVKALRGESYNTLIVVYETVIKI